MDGSKFLSSVKSSLGVTGDYQDETLTEYINEVVDFLIDAGVVRSFITTGIVSRGVSDLWNYGGGGGQLSSYFYQRATQLAKRSSSVNEIYWDDIIDRPVPLTVDEIHEIIEMIGGF